MCTRYGLQRFEHDEESTFYYYYLSVKKERREEKKYELCVKDRIKTPEDQV